MSTDGARHAAIRELTEYWEGIRPVPGLLPARAHLNPAAIARLLPDIWMLDVQHEPFRLRYRLAGTAVVASHARELTNLWFDEAHPELPPDYFHRYREVVETGWPSWRRGPPILDERRRETKILENIVLPLANDGRQVDILLCLTKVFSPALS